MLKKWYNERLFKKKKRLLLIFRVLMADYFMLEMVYLSSVSLMIHFFFVKYKRKS